MNKKRKTINSLPPFINAKSKILFIGTSPGNKSKLFYYQHETNKFWKCLFKIYKPIKNYNKLFNYERILCQMKYLNLHRIALWDICKICTRIGSDDNSIKCKEYNDICELLLQYKNIKKIYVCGDKAKELVDKYFPHLKYEKIPSFSCRTSSVDDLAKNLKHSLRKNKLLY